MDNYTFEWAVGRKHRSLAKMIVNDKTIIDWNKRPQVAAMDLGTDHAYVNMRGIPLVHLRAITDEILSKSAQVAQGE